jgi:GntR family transcriptional regulator/MocR family aminotransferase
MTHFKRAVPPALRNLPPHASSRQAALVEMLSSAIAGDALPADLPLPSCRALGAVHGVSKNTVQAAYDRLVELGLVTVRRKSGYFIAITGRDGRRPGAVRSVVSPLIVPEPRPSILPRVKHPVPWQNCAFPFIYNQIDPKLFPIAAWRECARLALGRRDLSNLTADDEAGDNPQLVSQLRKRLLAHRGIASAEGEVMITLGTQNALSLVGLLLREVPGCVAVEDPGYPDARNAFTLTGNQIRPVPVDEEGLRVDRIPAGCKLVYVTPSHQFPTSVTLSLARRQALLEQAEREGFLIIEDDYEADLEPDATLPTLRSMDRQGRVIYASSLSKTLSPGLRLGFVVAPPDIIEELRALRHALLRHAPTPEQATAALFIGLGHYDAHLRRLSKDRDRRRDAMRAGLASYLPMLRAQGSRSGSSFWLTAPEDLDSDALAEELLGKGVLLDPGRIFYMKQTRTSSFRLGFAAIEPDKIDAGLRHIANSI